MCRVKGDGVKTRENWSVAEEESETELHGKGKWAAKDEGVIMDLKKEITWANSNAWSPSIVEKKTKGDYKYFFYYTAGKKIGVAVVMTLVVVVVVLVVVVNRNIPGGESRPGN